jgi:hypothetical protein
MLTGRLAAPCPGVGFEATDITGVGLDQSHDAIDARAGRTKPARVPGYAPLRQTLLGERLLSHRIFKTPVSSLRLRERSWLRASGAIGQGSSRAGYASASGSGAAGLLPRHAYVFGNDAKMRGARYCLIWT